MARPTAVRQREEESQTRTAASTHLLHGGVSRFSDGGPFGSPAVAAAQTTVIASSAVVRRVIIYPLSAASQTTTRPLPKAQ